MTALLDDEPRLNRLQPLAYGYMRVPCDVPDNRVRKLEDSFRAFASERGLFFVTFFFEFRCSACDALCELITELQRADAHHVVIPSMRHFAHNPLLQDIRRTRLEHEAAAEVLVLRETRRQQI